MLSVRFQVSGYHLIELHIESTDFWRKMSYYVCIPALAVFGTYVYNVEIEHKAHNQHLMDENDGKLPQPPRYEYLNVRRKPYPWGMNSLFFNPKVRLWSGCEIQVLLTTCSRRSETCRLRINLSEHCVH
ncbi:cytochrome c oxidase subunit VIa-domain-containing protein [Mycena haematopus]|nr:cytochrome c oxidase subunit VIa-domain-containing protein [Mycena haematopus]